MKEKFPRCEQVTESCFDETKIRNADLIIINTAFVGHSLGWRAKGIALAAQVPVTYTNKSNLNNMARDILKNLAIL